MTEGEDIDGKIILVSETGADIPPELAQQYGIHTVPMHVSFGDVMRDDGAFPSDEICAYYEQTKALPKTSASTPEDFRIVFDRIHTQWPEAKILYLAYSAVTTSTFQSAQIAAEGRDYVTSLDTKQVSAGEYAILIRIAQLLEQHPEWEIAQVVAAAEDLIDRAKMCFIPDKLEYLRAGGRLSRLAPQLVQDYAAQYDLERDEVWLVWSPGFPEELREPVERSARSCGFRKITWVKTGGVITTHGGPSAFGVIGFSAKEDQK